ncbi:hypothetical protein [Paenibacillus sp. NPDC058071]|uniref:hypothetical protein n=1 Tax=Paenibacillus sp. NPDC058071 TaxID=3346326 RepID=UPI0036DF3D5E
MRKKAWIALAVCFSVVAGGLTLAAANGDRAEVASSDLIERFSDATASYEAQKKIADSPGATTEDEQRLKELATKAADLKAEIEPPSAREQFSAVFAAYKDMYAIESSYYVGREGSDDAAVVQRVLVELERKGQLIEQFEQLDANEEVDAEELLERFHEETAKLKQE